MLILRIAILVLVFITLCITIVIYMKLRKNENFTTTLGPIEMVQDSSGNFIVDKTYNYLTKITGIPVNYYFRLMLNEHYIVSAKSDANGEYVFYEPLPVGSITDDSDNVLIRTIHTEDDDVPSVNNIQLYAYYDTQSTLPVPDTNGEITVNIRACDMAPCTTGKEVVVPVKMIDGQFKNLW